jgi:hypothetical protein
MTRIIAGSCHCNNLSYELMTRIPAADISARTCDCHFCSLHAAQNWSDPAGTAVIRVADAQQLQRYRFALRTADFYICRICGNYLGAILADSDGTWSTLNLRLTGMALAAAAASYGAEDTGARITSRKNSGRRPPSSPRSDHAQG